MHREIKDKYSSRAYLSLSLSRTIKDSYYKRSETNINLLLYQINNI